MTPTAWIALLGVGGPALIALTAWVVRSLLLDRIAQLEATARRFGERIGELESWRMAHEAVVRDRRRRDTRGVPAPDDESGP